jgi:hypothetical protein
MVVTQNSKGTKEYAEKVSLLLSPVLSHLVPQSSSFFPWRQTLLAVFCCVLFCFFGGTGVWTQSFALAKQALYCLNHTSSFFCSTGAWTQGLHLSHSTSPFLWRVFEIGSLGTICLGWFQTEIFLISVPWIAGITGVSHQSLALAVFDTGSFYVAQAGLELEILMLQPIECRNHKYVPTCQALLITSYKSFQKPT